MAAIALCRTKRLSIALREVRALALEIAKSKKLAQKKKKFAKVYWQTLNKHEDIKREYKIFVINLTSFVNAKFIN